MAAPDFLRPPQVAELLGIAASLFLRKRLALEAEHGFPEPMPQSLRPLLWRRDRVEIWLAMQGLPRAEAMATDRPRGANVFLIEEARRA